MEFWITVVALLRRKRVIIPALLIAVGLGATAYLVTPVSYVSSTTMVLTTTQFGGSESRDPTKPTDLTNPMLNFNDSLTTTSAILIEGMNTQAVNRQVGATEGTQLIVDDGRTNPNLLGLNGPFLYIVGRSTASPAEARRVVLNAQAVAQEKLRAWQSALNAPSKTYVSLAEVVPPSAPISDRARGVKYGLLAFLLGFMLCLGIAYLRDRRRVRRDARQKAIVTARAANDGPDPGRDPSPAGDLLPEVDEQDVESTNIPMPWTEWSRPDIGPAGVNGKPSPAADPAHLNGHSKPADLNGHAKPAVDPTHLNGRGTPAVDPTDTNGHAKPTVEQTDVNAQAGPVVEPTESNGTTRSPVLGASRSRRSRPFLMHVPVKRTARSRKP